MNRALTYTRLRPEDVPALRSRSAGHVLGTEIFTSLALDPDETNERLWVARDNGGAPVAAVYDYPSHTVWLSPGRACVGRHAANPAGVFAPPRRKDRYAVMEKRGAPAGAVPPSVRRAEGETLRALFAMLGGGMLSRRSQELHYVYMRRCLNRGLAAAFCVYLNGEPVSCAMIGAENERFALIGNVYTLPSHRGRGYASAALAACEAFAAEQGKTPVLYCEKKTAAFYRGRGYRKVRIR